MKMLETQAQFEEMWFGDAKPWIVYFTAIWCKPCQRLDSEALAKVAEEKDITMWKCELTVNEYTAGYCGVRSIPTFVYFKPKAIVSTLQSSDTESVKLWIESCA
jgi:thioredoxin-like negative regulator of GroEL